MLRRSAQRRRLRLLSFNIQTGITTSRYRQYVTQSWRHVLPFAQRSGNLDTIANLVSDYDLVGLQEVDAGSIRSGTSIRPIPGRARPVPLLV